MTRLRQNFQRGTITNNPLAIGGTTLNSAALADLQVVAAPDVMTITLDPLGRYGAPEIVYVTTHSAAATSATIFRAGEGTSARAHPVGTVWEHTPTTGDFLRLERIFKIVAGTVTYTTPSNNIHAILVECIGGGGGGGGAAQSGASAAGGGGGSGGGFAQKLILSPDASYPCVVGAGGAGGAAGANDGADGADTTFAFPSVCTALGGNGGTGMAAGTAALFAAGGTGSGATVGTVLLGAIRGNNGIRLSGTVAAGGHGSPAPRYGNGGSGFVVEAAGGVGNLGGGGGGGCCLGTTARAGGDGGDGVIFVYEYY